MTCRHTGKELGFGTECKITKNKCIFLDPDEDKCSKQPGAWINYLKNLGTYESKVKDNPEFT
jgi:hypothetical protein